MAAAVRGSRTEQPPERLPFLAEPLHTAATQGWLVPARSPCCHFLAAGGRVLVLCCVAASLMSALSLSVLFLLSPLHSPLSVCQNTDGPLLGPCHLVSIRVTLVTASLPLLCA